MPNSMLESMKRWTRVGLDTCNILLKLDVPPDEKMYELRRIRDHADANLHVATQEAAMQLKLDLPDQERRRR